MKFYPMITSIKPAGSSCSGDKNKLLVQDVFVQHSVLAVPSVKSSRKRERPRYSPWLQWRLSLHLHLPLACCSRNGEVTCTFEQTPKPPDLCAHIEFSSQFGQHTAPSSTGYAKLTAFQDLPTWQRGRVGPVSRCVKRM
jgi:hypothetical protein